MDVKRIFVVGGGLMGSGIAQVAAAAGYTVTLYDSAPGAGARALREIGRMLDKGVARAKLTQEMRDATLARISLGDSLAEAADAELAIEAVAERLEVKKAVFTALSKVCRPDAILATNTSSISIAELASAVKNPERVLGMHFFSPVPLMKLLELVRAIGTAPETVETARAVGQQMGKVCIVAKDSPAFVVNRMLDPMINEAISMVETHLATIEDIDLGMKCGLNHPMGPLELIDMAGIDIELAVMEVLYRETGDPKYRPALLLRDMVRMNWLGRKTGKGFYVYHEDGTRSPNPDL